MKSMDKKKERTFRGPLDGQIEAEGRLILLLRNYTPPNQKKRVASQKHKGEVKKKIDYIDYIGGRK